VQDAKFGMGWGSFELIHSRRVAGPDKKFQPFFQILWAAAFGEATSCELRLLKKPIAFPRFIE
jgi:hypothetical protein